MATMTIRNIDDDLKARLRVQAAQHGRSMEDEARDILRAALSAEPVRGNSLVASIRRRVEALGGVELELPERDPIPEPPGAGPTQGGPGPSAEPAPSRYETRYVQAGTDAGAGAGTGSGTETEADTPVGTTDAVDPVATLPAQVTDTVSTAVGTATTTLDSVLR